MGYGALRRSCTEGYGGVAALRLRLSKVLHGASNMSKRCKAISGATRARNKQKQNDAVAAARQRAAAKLQSSKTPAASSDSSQTSAFTIAYIPADDTAALATWTIEVPQNEPNALVGCLTERLKLHFQQSTMTAAQRKAFEAHVAAEAQKRKKAAGGKKKVDTKAVAQLMAMQNMQTVDIVPLLHNTQLTDWVSVNLYVDDRGPWRTTHRNEGNGVLRAVSRGPAAAPNV